MYFISHSLTRSFALYHFQNVCTFVAINTDNAYHIHLTNEHPSCKVIMFSGVATYDSSATFSIYRTYLFLCSLKQDCKMHRSRKVVNVAKLDASKMQSNYMCKTNTNLFAMEVIGVYLYITV